MAVKLVLFDVANTLLKKNSLHQTILEVLNKYGYDITIKELVTRHKLLTEAITFPRTTSWEFYQKFNSELFYALGIIPSNDIIQEIFESCKHLEWSRFDDVEALKNLRTELGIISNWDPRLKQVLLKTVGNFVFKEIIFSSEVGFDKPDLRIFNHALKIAGYERDEIVYIGDSIKLDIEPAISLGIKAILIDRDNIYPAYQGDRISSLKQLNRKINEYAEE